MKNLLRTTSLRMFKLLDIASIAVSFILAIIISTRRLEASELLHTQIQVSDIVAFLVLLFGWHMVFLWGHLYESRRIGTRAGEYYEILKCITMGSVLVLALGVFLHWEILNKSFFAWFWGLLLCIMVLGRLLLRNMLETLRRNGMNRRFVLIAGSRSNAQQFAEKIERRPELGYVLVGFVDDAPEPSLLKGQFQSRLIGTLKDIPQVLRNSVVDEVIISLPIKSYYEQIEGIVRLCAEHGIIVRFLRGVFSLTSANFRFSLLDDMPVITLCSSPYEDPQILVKRLFDIVVSAFLLVLTLPLLLAVYVTLKVLSPGPAFFIQKRVGYNKRIFNLVKFRTMVEDAEALISSLEHLNETDGPTFKMKNDPRLTGIGRILRSTSIDELPQLWNVFKGDMSLVGPRPLPVRDYAGFDSEWQSKRFSMKPGITCFWQVGGRSKIDFERWMEMDVKYVDTWSLWLDIKILLKTIPTVLLRRGAY